MGHIKNLQRFHLVAEGGKKTECGLSNQYKDADTKEEFIRHFGMDRFRKWCCKKCAAKINLVGM